jgi:hypothetical protein
VKPSVDGPNELLDALVDGIDLLGRDQPAGDAALVADHGEAKTFCSEAVECPACAGNGHHAVRVAVVGDVLDKRPIPVEQHGRRTRAALVCRQQPQDTSPADEPVDGCCRRKHCTGRDHADDFVAGTRPRRNPAPGELRGAPEPGEAGESGKPAAVRMAGRKG